MNQDSESFKLQLKLAVKIKSFFFSFNPKLIDKPKQDRTFPVIHTGFLKKQGKKCHFSS